MLAYITYPSWIRPEIIPGLPIRWYGLMYLLAFVVTYLLFTWQLRKREIVTEKDVVLDMFFWAIIGLLVGARAFAVTIYDSTGYYLQHPLQIILPSPGWTEGSGSPALRACPIMAGLSGPPSPSSRS